MNERRKPLIARIFNIPVRLRKGSAISEQDVDAAKACSNGLPVTLCSALPAEIQILILQQCSFVEVMQLRCVSRDYCNLVTLHGAALFRHFIRVDELASVADVYECAVLPKIEPSFHNLCGLRHRAIIADKFAQFLVTYRMCEKARLQPAVLFQVPRIIIMLRLAVIGLRPYFFILYHFFEAFRAILAYTSERKGSCDDAHREDASRMIETWLMNRYTPDAKSLALRLWDQVMRIVYRKLRPATYATKLERKLRGWNHPPASEGHIRDLLVFGGLEALYRVITVHGFASRMKAFDKMVLSVQTPSETSSKDDMRVVFGVMPPLPMDTVTFIRKRMHLEEPLRILSGEEATTAPLTQEEVDLTRDSDLGMLAPLCAKCDEHLNAQLVADTKGEIWESLERCCRNPSKIGSPQSLIFKNRA